MKTLSYIILITSIFSSVNIFSQQQSGNLVIEGYSYPQPILSNIFKWVDLSTSEWEKKMKKYDFSDRGLTEGCVYYGSGTSISGVYSIKKCPGYKLDVTWADYGQKGITTFDQIMNELEPYFWKNEQGFLIYSVRKGNFDYLILVNRDRNTEGMYISREYNK